MFVIDVPYFSIRQTFFSGQTLLWNRYDRNADHTRYTIQHGDKLLGVAQKGERLILNCTEDDFFDVWYEYLDIGTDYQNVNRSLMDCQGHMREFATYSDGVHVVNQGAHEAFLTTLLRYRQYGTESKRLMRWLCENCGEESRKLIKGLGSVKYFTVPTVEQLYSKLWLIGETFLDVEYPDEQQALDFCTMDRVYQYVCAAYDGDIDFEHYQQMDDEKLLLDLRMHEWIPDERVRKRIMLYGFGRNVFPMSDFMEQKIKKHTHFEPDLFVDWYLQDSPYKGYASQYMLYKFLNPIERQDKWVW